MSETQFERTPLNAEGDFYVVKDMCITCMAPHHEAPELMGMDEETGCYFRRQPQTAEELESAVEAVRVSCVEALRYSGDDPEILARFRAKGCKSQSDVLSPDGGI
jgi:ferredoxin